MTKITHVLVESDKQNYTFEIQESEGQLVATCEQDDGGLNTVGKDWNELAEMLDDCVKTWEEM